MFTCRCIIIVCSSHSESVRLFFLSASSEVVKKMEEDDAPGEYCS